MAGAKMNRETVYKLMIKIDGDMDPGLANALKQTRKNFDEINVGGLALSKTFLSMGKNADFSLGSILDGINLVQSGATSMGAAVGSIGIGLALEAGTKALEGLKWGLMEVVDIIKDGVGAASEFEDAMVGVSKVTPGIRDEKTGGYTALYNQYKEDIQNLAIEIPGIDAIGMADIYADAGRAGVGEGLPDAERRKELARFAEVSAKQGLAMDMTVEESGGYARYFYGKMGLSVDKIEELGDLVNMLDDKSIATGKSIMEVLATEGAFADMANLDIEKLAMLATVLGAGGEGDGDPGTISTTIENLVKRFSGGAGQGSAKYEKSLDKLGYTKASVQNSMYKDPMGTIIEILGKVSERKEDKIEILSSLAGAQATSGLAFLNKAMETGAFEKMMNILGGDSYHGSVESEYGYYSDTYSAKKEALTERWDTFLVTIGEPFMDGLKHVWDVHGDKILKNIPVIADGFFDMADTIFKPGGSADRLIGLIPEAVDAFSTFIDELSFFLENPALSVLDLVLPGNWFGSEGKLYGTDGWFDGFKSALADGRNTREFIKAIFDTSSRERTSSSGFPLGPRPLFSPLSDFNSRPLTVTQNGAPTFQTNVIVQEGVNGSNASSLGAAMAKAAENQWKTEMSEWIKTQRRDAYRTGFDPMRRIDMLFNG